MAKAYKKLGAYSNLKGGTTSPKKYVRGKVGNADFENAKQADRRSSAVPAAGNKGNWSRNNTNIHSEVARQRRLGKNVTSSGPKPRKPGKKK